MMGQTLADCHWRLSSFFFFCFVFLDVCVCLERFVWCFWGVFVWCVLYFLACVFLTGLYMHR